LVLADIAPDAGSEDVIKLLKTCFGTELQKERFKAELRACRRRDGEQLQHLYRDISRLVSLAHPSDDAKLVDHVGKEAFIRALNDGPLQLEVLKGEPETLEEVYNSATKFEAYEQSLVKQGMLDRPLTCVGTSDDDRPRRRARAVNAVTDGEDDEIMDQWRVDHLQNLLEQATKGITAMAAKNGATGASKSGRSADSGKSSSSKKGSGENSGRGRGGRRLGRKQDPKVDPCKRCGEVGHWIKDCKQPAPPAKEQAGANAVYCQLVSPTCIYVGGKPVQCLLDSGCERSVVSRNLVPNARLTRSKYNLRVADKARLSILGDTKLHFVVDGSEFEANVSVSLAIDSFLLGSDWLEANEAKWDLPPALSIWEIG